MKLLSKEEFTLLRSEVSDYINLCNENNYEPNRSDIQDIIEFSIETDSMINLFELYQSNSNFMIDHICESFELNEKGFRGATDYDNKKDFDAGVKMVGAGAVMAGAAAVGVGVWINYLFKKRKVKKLVAQQTELNIKKLGSFNKLLSMKNKLAELEGEEPSSIDWPSYT